MWRLEWTAPRNLPSVKDVRMIHETASCAGSVSLFLFWIYVDFQGIYHVSMYLAQAESIWADTITDVLSLYEDMSSRSLLARYDQNKFPLQHT